MVDVRHRNITTEWEEESGVVATKGIILVVHHADHLAIIHSSNVTDNKETYKDVEGKDVLNRDRYPGTTSLSPHFNVKNRDRSRFGFVL